MLGRVLPFLCAACAVSGSGVIPDERFILELEASVEIVLGDQIQDDSICDRPISELAILVCTETESCRRWMSEYGDFSVLRELEHACERICTESLIWLPHLFPRYYIEEAVEETLNEQGMLVLGEHGFQLLETISTTLTSVVYRALWEEKVVALKCRPPQHASRNEYYQMHLLQGESWCPKVYTRPILNGRIRCFAMELIRGQNLKQLRDQGPVPQQVVRSIGMQMTSILKQLHLTHGIVHADAHRENWIRNEEGKIVLMDYELSQPISPGKGASELQTMAHTLTTFYRPQAITPDAIAQLMRYTSGLVRSSTVIVDAYDKIADIISML
jgi:predicted Ser/Thr protein kinase